MQSKPPTWQSRAAEVFAWGAALLAWAVCLTSEVILAWQHGFAGLLAVGWALGLDMTALSCMFLALDAAKRGRRTGEVWAIAFGATVAMIAANVLVAGHDLIGAVMHGASPVLAVALWHALVHGRQAVGETSGSLLEPVIEARLDERINGGQETPRLQPEPASHETPQETPRPPRTTRRTGRRDRGRPPTGDMRQRVSRLLEETPGVSVRAAAAELGVSPSHAGRLLREARGASTT